MINQDKNEVPIICKGCGKTCEWDDDGLCGGCGKEEYKQDKKEQICECGHIVDNHIEQIDGKAISGECFKCDCRKYKEKEK